MAPSGELRAAREELAAACRALASTGLVTGTAGNLSRRVGSHVLITPTGADLADMAADDIPLVDLGGALVDGTLEPSSELELHLGAYRRFGAGAVVHTHAPMATAVACALDELPCVHYAMVELGGAVPVAPYATFGTAELARAVHDALAGRGAVLMANHGTLTLGAELREAVARTELLEWAATLYWRAAQLGKPRLIGAEALEAVRAELARRDYGAVRSASGSPGSRPRGSGPASAS